jgi:hypothetical protein
MQRPSRLRSPFAPTAERDPRRRERGSSRECKLQEVFCVPNNVDSGVHRGCSCWGGDQTVSEREHHHFQLRACAQLLDS